MSLSSKVLALFVSLMIVNTVVFSDVSEENNDWKLYQVKFFFENDLFAKTDNQYTSGEKLNFIYHVNNPTSPIYNLLISGDSNPDIFTGFSLANQIYTPVDLTSKELVVDDRPYAGWTYVESSIHKSTKGSLNSILLKIGMIGPASQAEEIQTGVHTMTGSDAPQGWDNQLGNELGINLTYAYKWRFISDPVGDFQSSFIPYLEADLGNVSTQASAGMFMRFGWNISKDFGLSTLDVGGEAGIPVYDEQEIILKKDWSFSINLTATGSLIARDIFLDGNTFKDSHSIEKNRFVAYGGAGISIRYKSFVFDFMQTANTKKADREGYRKVVGTVLVTWLY